MNLISQPASAMDSATALNEIVAPQLTRFIAFQGRDEGSAQAELAKHWLHLLHEEDAPSAFAVAERLSYFLDRMSADALGRWILAGWRYHATDLTKQRAWFRLDVPQSIAALYGEAGAQPLQEALPSLELLINGLLKTMRPATHSTSALPLRVQARQQTKLHAPRLRPVLSSTHFLVPDDYTVLDGAEGRSRLHRAAVAHAVAHLRYSSPARPVRTLKPIGLAVVSAIEDARVEHLLLRDFPGARGWFIGALASPPTWPKSIKWYGFSLPPRTILNPCPRPSFCNVRRRGWSPCWMCVRPRNSPPATYLALSISRFTNSNGACRSCRSARKWSPIVAALIA